MMAKKKSVPKEGDKNWASITMQINEAHFHAEGDSAEVQEKFRLWLDERLAPIKKTMDVARKAFQEKA
jgi:hypothetical protein